MKRLKRILLGLLIAFLLIQFIQPTKNIGGYEQSTDLVKTVTVPYQTQAILKAACYDCHSNNTRYPWYAGVQPFGWLLANHIREGKAELNFNEFGSYSLRRQMSKLKGIGNSVRDGSMPLSSYIMLHKNARLSKEDKELIIQWATRTKDSLELNK
jgi:hypothetical protein